MKYGQIIRLKMFAVCVLLIASSICFAAIDALAEDYEIPGQNDLHFDVPDGWRYELDSSEKDLPPTIVTGAENANEFKVMITPLWRGDGSPLGFSSEKLRELMEKESEEILPQAVEDRVEIRELKGKETYGYCYGVTDKSLVGKELETGDYRYMFRCSVIVGEVLLSATILCQGSDDPLIQKALTMFENARQSM